MTKGPPSSQIVPDSEDEEELTIDNMMSSNTSGASSIQPPTTSMEHPAAKVSQISSFTDGHPLSIPPISFLPGVSAISSGKSSLADVNGVPLGLLRDIPATTDQTAGSFRPKPKPRPRPRPKVSARSTTGGEDLPDTPHISSKEPPPPPNPVSYGSPSSLPESSFIPGLNFANGAQSDPPLEPAALASSSYGQGVAERAKLRSRAAASKGKETEKARSPAAHIDVIDIVSDSEDELSFLPKEKTKGKGKGKGKDSNDASTKARATKSPRKKAKAIHEEDEGAESNSTPVTLPIATSQPELPPSDEPGLPSFEPLIPSQSVANIPARHASEVPQKETVGEQPSSPAPSRKRKRTVTSSSRVSKTTTHDDDDDAGERMPPPPPPFFAGSSSSIPMPSDPPRTPSPLSPVPPEPAGLAPVKEPDVVPAKGAAKEKKTRKRKAADSDDESDWAESSSKRKPKPRARKRKALDDGDFDSDGSNWHGDESPTRGKAKSKAKPQVVGKPKKQGKGRAQQVIVEVVPPPRSRRNTASVSPAKSKANTSPIPIEKLSTEPPDSGVGSSEKAGEAEHEHESDGERPVASSKAGSKKTKKRTTTKARSVPAQEEEASVEQIIPPADEPVKSARQKSKSKTRAAVIVSEDEDAEEIAHGVELSPVKKTVSTRRHAGKSSSGTPDAEVEVEDPSPDNTGLPSDLGPAETPQNKRASSSSALHASSSASDRKYRIPRRDKRSMDEIIRKANSYSNSPFPATRSTYSPFAKMSRSVLRNIVPLHPNRKTPPPPPPRPPPPKKSKKMLELEEKWEMELEDTVEGWYAMTEEERAQLRRAKRDTEMGYDD